ncbi:MAG: tyrosine-protein phosphatase [Sphingomonadales bacterium]|nr:tyrosine-protein phosphatase [Sphingomonadales bacterium]
MADPDARLIALEGIHNFRDYGGYPVAGGGRVRRGWLWRSGQHHEATDADLDQVRALGLKAVFDLRSARERASHPCRRPAGFSAVLHAIEDAPPIDGGPGVGKGATPAAPHVAAAHAAAARPSRERTPEETREGMRHTYATMPFRPALAAALRQMMTVLARTDGPSLVNCMAGKDRTGIAVAIVQRALGVHRDDVVGDYLLTGRLGDQEARIAAGYRTFVQATGELEDAVVRAIMGIEPSYIEAALDAVAAAGGEERYFRDVLGVDPGARAALRARLVEG